MAAPVDDTELFKTLRNLLASRRQPGDVATPSSSPRASSADVQNLLGALQRGSTGRTDAEYDSEHFRNVERHTVETIPGVLLMRIDESLFFGNLNAIEARLASELEKAPQTHDVVLVMSGVNRVDATAMEVLADANRELQDRNIRLHFAEVKGPVQDRLASSPLWPALSGKIFLSANAAYASLIDAEPNTGAHLSRPCDFEVTI